MTNIKLYIDTNRLLSDNTAPVSVYISHNGQHKYLRLGISVNPIVLKKGVDRCGDNLAVRSHLLLQQKFLKAKAELLRMQEDGLLFTFDELYDAVYKIFYPQENSHKQRSRKPSFWTVCESFAASKSPGSLQTYVRLFKYLRAFPIKWDFDKVTKSTLAAFDNFMAQNNLSINTRGIYLRNLRAIFNHAIDEGLTKNYPFRTFKIKKTVTAKRSMSAEQIRLFLNSPATPRQQFYRDMFMLSFFLIGANFKDMLFLPKTALCNGRITFNRAKTNKLYDIKVEPEASELIKKHLGKKFLLSPMDTCSNHLDFISNTNCALQNLGRVIDSGLGCDFVGGFFGHITTYWARHSWATIASYFDIPKETIAAALGHGGSTVTDIYIDFDRRKVDVANRRVIDWVLYGTR